MSRYLYKKDTFCCTLQLNLLEHLDNFLLLLLTSFTSSRPQRKVIAISLMTYMAWLRTSIGILASACLRLDLCRYQGEHFWTSQRQRRRRQTTRTWIRTARNSKRHRQRARWRWPLRVDGSERFGQWRNDGSRKCARESETRSITPSGSEQKKNGLVGMR